MVFTIKSSAAELSNTPSTVSNANRVLLQHTGNGLLQLLSKVMILFNQVVQQFKEL